MAVTEAHYAHLKTLEAYLQADLEMKRRALETTPTPVIQFSRAVLIDGGFPTFKAHVLLVIMAAAVFAGGAAIFRAYSPNAAEHLQGNL